MASTTGGDINGNGDLAYWMGKVDNQLVTIQTTLAQLASNDRSNWSDFKEWRADVDERLADGSRNFVRIDDRIIHLEGDIALMQKHFNDIATSFRGCQAEKIAALRDAANDKPNGKGLEKTINNGNSITYKWLLEKVLLPVGIGFATWFLLTVLPDIIK